MPKWGRARPDQPAASRVTRSSSNLFFWDFNITTSSVELHHKSSPLVDAAIPLPTTENSSMPPIHDALLQSNAIPDESSSIQVPSQLLNQLLSTVVRLEKKVDRLEDDNKTRKEENQTLISSISQLRRDNATISSELQRVRENIGGRFPLFSRLPAEIRYMIWTFSMRTPQIHVIKDKAMSTSKINGIMHTCREARDVGLSMSLDYYCLELSDGDDLNLVDWHTPKFYMNVDVDTIWYYDNSEGPPYLPVNIEFFCGRCPEQTELFSVEDLDSRCQHNPRLKSLAVQESCFEEPSASYSSYGQQEKTDLLRRCQPLELLLVLGHLGTLSLGAGHYTLEEPRQKPYDLNDLMGQNQFRDLYDWCSASDRLEAILEAHRAHSKQHYIETSLRKLLDSPCIYSH